MKKYFGEINPAVPKNVALKILEGLTPSTILQYQLVSKAWRSLLTTNTLYLPLGVKNYDELRFHASQIKSLFGQYLLQKIANNSQKLTSTACTKQMKELDDCSCDQELDSGKLNWHQVRKIDSIFLGIEQSIRDGYAVSIWGQWVGECNRAIIEQVCRLLTNDQAKTDFYTYCGSHSGTYANFFYNALKKAPEFAEARVGIPEEEESEDEYFAMN